MPSRSLHNAEIHPATQVCSRQQAGYTRLLHCHVFYVTLGYDIDTIITSVNHCDIRSLGKYDSIGCSTYPQHRTQLSSCNSFLGSPSTSKGGPRWSEIKCPEPRETELELNWILACRQSVILTQNEFKSIPADRHIGHMWDVPRSRSRSLTPKLRDLLVKVDAWECKFESDCMLNHFSS